MATQSGLSEIHSLLGGVPVLGRPVSNQSEMIELIRLGLPHSSLETLLSTIGVSTAAAARMLDLPLRTLVRRKQENRLSARESDLVFRLARVFARTEQVFEDREKAARWFQKPVRALGGATPLSQMDTDAGALEVERVLGRIEHGVFS